MERVRSFFTARVRSLEHVRVTDISILILMSVTLTRSKKKVLAVDNQLAFQFSF